MILLTGATGLVGSHAALFLLQKKERVRAIYRTSDSLQKTRQLFKYYEHDDLFDLIEWVPADVNDIPALESAFLGVNEVWHCAALISFDRNDEERIRKINIEGTANIVNLSLAHGVGKLCFVSSVAALGDPKFPTDLVNEEIEWNPEKHHTDYAISKYGAEMEVWRGQQEGLKTIIVNPGVILGPVMWNQGSGEIFSTIADDLPFYTLGSGGFVAVDDVVEIVYRLMKGDVNGQRYAVVSETIVYRDLSFMIADALGNKRPYIHAQPWMTEIAWITDWLLSKLIRRKRKLFKETAWMLHTGTIYSSRKVQDELNFKFTNISSYIKRITMLHSNNKII